MREVSAALKSHLEQNSTTTCKLLKIALANGEVYGMTSLDKDLSYDGVDYVSANGFDHSDIAADIGLSVDNSEGKLLVAESLGITKEMIEAGELDDATWNLMIVNWKDTFQGHMIIDSGDIGEVRLVDDVFYVVELLSLSMRLRQHIGHVWQKSCRAIFGQGEVDSSGPIQTETQTYCGVDESILWQDGTVTGVDTVGDSSSPAEPRRVFEDNSLVDSSAVESIPPARVQWITGNNASEKLYQVEVYDDTTGALALVEPTPYEIEIGDTFRIRPDCDKSLANCKIYDNVINFKGEPHIPVADGVEATTPYAQI